MAIDILLLVIVAVGGIIGFNKGIVSQIGQIAAVLVGIVAARMFGAQLADIISGTQAPSTMESVSGYAIAFLGAYCLTWLVAKMVRTVFHTVHLGIIDRLAGAAFKVLQWALMLSLAVNFYLLVTGDDQRLHDPGSPWRQAVVDLAPATLGYLNDLTHNNTGSQDVNTQTTEDETK